MKKFRYEKDKIYKNVDSIHVLHVSPTPLVDSPRKISKTLEKYSRYKSNCFIFKDYPGKLQGVFSSNVLIYNKSKDLIVNLISNADIIHIHNFLTKEQEHIIFSNSKSTVCFIYQSHSPLKEGPVFTEYAEGGKLKFDAKCVIAQYHPRLYPDYKIVPNIILHTPSINLIKDDEIPKVLFSPAHTRTGGRWNDKTIKELDIILSQLQSLGLIEVIVASNVTPHELYEIRKQCHISIDEIVTGSYHQVSLEALCAGNVTINNSDIFSDLMLKSIIKKDVKIPFYKMNKYNIYEKLYCLINDKKLIRDKQQDSYDFYNKYFSPKQLIQHYIKLYEEVINDI